MTKTANQPDPVSRREFARRCALGAIALTSAPILGCRSLARMARGPASRRIPLEQDWLFGGECRPAAMAPDFDDSAFARISLPHCAAGLSWQNWEPATWQKVWIYRRHFTLPEGAGGLRTFLHFDGVMVGDNPFSLAESGGIGAIWVRTLPGRFGRITVKGVHSLLGAKSVEVDVRRLLRLTGGVFGKRIGALC